MPSLRRSLTRSYAIALTGTAILFAGAVWLGSLYASDRRVNLVIERQKILLARAQNVVSYIETLVALGLEGITTYGSDIGGLLVVGDSTYMDLPGDTTELLAPAIRDQLAQRRGGFPDSLNEYLVVFSRDRRPLYTSRALRLLLAREAADSALAIVNDLATIPDEGGIAERRVLDRKLLLVSMVEPSGGSSVAYVVVGTEEPTATTASEQVFLMVLVVAPFLILLSLYAGYSMAGRPLEPVEQIINEVEAITDGRSLHKRLQVDHANAELKRLSTTLNEMMERLEKSFTTLRTFTADASHELNTPLAVLRADVERAMDARISQEDRMQALEEALREIRRMTDLVDSLLTLARADEGRLDLHLERVELAPLVQEVYETAELLAEEGGLSVRLVILEEGAVDGDPDRLRQLFLNLVSNAIKYTPAGGKVELSLSRRLDGIAFSVRDTGIGIAAADLPHIFERFWRADHSRSRTAERTGFGLGLPICNWIAQAHGGSLTATSKLGKGSTFTVLLPMAQEVAGREPE